MLCLPKEQLFHFQRLKRYQQTLSLLEIFLYQGSIVYRHKGAYEHAKSKQKGRATFALKKATTTTSAAKADGCGSSRSGIGASL